MKAWAAVAVVGAVAAAFLIAPTIASAKDEGSPSVQSTATEPASAPDPDSRGTGEETEETSGSTSTEDADQASGASSTEGGDTPEEPADEEPADDSEESSNDSEESSTQASTESVKAPVKVEDSSAGATTAKVDDGSCTTARVAQVEPRQGPVPEDCERAERGDFEGNEDGDPETQVTVDGVTVTLVIKDTENGEVVEWSSDQPFFGTIEVKGGVGGSTICEGNGETSGTCSAPLNPSGKFADVSFVQVCPGEPPTNGNGPGNGPTQNGGPGPTPEGGVAGEAERGGAALGQVAAVPAAAGAAAAGAAAEALPFTGLDTMWLLLLGGLLVGSGAILRVRLG